MTNAGFIAAAYGLTALVLVGYTLSIWRQLARLHMGNRSGSADASKT